MEIQRTPVTLEQRMEYLTQATANVEVNKKSFPWATVIVSLIAGAALSVVVIYFVQKKKEKEAGRS